MVSRENTVISVFVVVATVLTFGGFLLTDVPDELLMGVLFFVGIVAPLMVNNCLDNEKSA